MYAINVVALHCQCKGDWPKNPKTTALFNPQICSDIVNILT